MNVKEKFVNVKSKECVYNHKAKDRDVVEVMLDENTRCGVLVLHKIIIREPSWGEWVRRIEDEDWFY